MAELNKNFFTPVPARRVSQNVTPELRIASDAAERIEIYTVRDGNKCFCGSYAIKNKRALNKIKPELNGIIGKFTLLIYFYDSGDNLLEVMEQDYEVVASDVASTCLLDGCWVSIYHWSEDEARYFNSALKKLTDEDWKQQIYSMNKIGVTSVLIQNVFDSGYYCYQHDKTSETYDGKAFYDSKLFPGRQPLSANDPIEAILSAADECDMAVFPGVGLYAWFDFSPESLKWHKMVAKELFDRYGHHKSFYGWYISEEIMGSLYYDYPPVDNDKYKDIQDFFREFKKFAHSLTPTKPIAMAPNNIRMHHYRDEWREIYKNLDIVIPFAFARSENNIAQIAEMCRETGTHFWVDMEIFDFPFDEGLRPKTCENLIKEIRVYDALEQVYGYQYTGLLNEPGHRMGLGMEETEVVYSQFKEYVNKIRSKKRLVGGFACAGKEGLM